MLHFWFRTSKADTIYAGTYDINSNHICNYCCSHVDKLSKHCKLCNKCILEFDHHCTVLNTCIGKANYQSFLGLISVFFLLQIVIGSYSAVQFFLYIVSPKDFLNKIGNLKLYFEIKAIVSINFTLGLLALLLSLPILLLLIFHIYLRTKRMTTYEYILKKRKKFNGPQNDVITGRKNESEKTIVVPAITI